LVHEDLEVAELPEEETMRNLKPKIKTVYVECYISKDHLAVRRLK
jgi:hypothetical protein